MPYGDGTGPQGRGRMSGRGAGYCAGYDRPGYASPGMGRGPGMGYGRGFGRGRGLGRGFGRGHGYYGPAFDPPDRRVPVYREPTPEEEKSYLESLAKDLEVELNQVKERINELAKKE